MSRSCRKAADKVSDSAHSEFKISRLGLAGSFSGYKGMIAVGYPGNCHGISQTISGDIFRGAEWVTIALDDQRGALCCL